MSERARSERKTQNRVAVLFTDASRPDCLGCAHNGEWSKCDKTWSLKQAWMQEQLTGRTRLV